jgi:hypothetical protein
LQKPQVRYQTFRPLKRGADHKTSANLIADFLQMPKALFAVFPIHRRRVQFCIVFGIGSLMSEKVSVRPGIEQLLVTVAGTLTERECNGTIGMLFSDFRDNFYDAVIIKKGVFPSLQDERSVAEFIAGFTARQNAIERKPIAVKMCVAAPNPAVETVIFAVVRQFDETAQINIGTVKFLPPFFCSKEQLLIELICGQKCGQLGIGQISCLVECFNNGHGCKKMISSVTFTVPSIRSFLQVVAALRTFYPVHRTNCNNGSTDICGYAGICTLFYPLFLISPVAIVVKFVTITASYHFSQPAKIYVQHTPVSACRRSIYSRFYATAHLCTGAFPQSSKGGTATRRNHACPRRCDGTAATADGRNKSESACYHRK